MSSRPVRLTKMIFALMATCGVRTSSSWRRATISGRCDGTSVMSSLFVAVSTVTEPRMRHVAPTLTVAADAPGVAAAALCGAVQSRESSVCRIDCSDVAFA